VARLRVRRPVTNVSTAVANAYPQNINQNTPYGPLR
jgi:hypothetical protein